MKAPSFWARDHQWPARLLLVFACYPLLHLSAWALGNILAAEGTSLPAAALYVPVAAALLLLLTYPARTAPWAHRKLFDGGHGACTFCLPLLFANGEPGAALPTLRTQVSHAAQPPTAIGPVKGKARKGWQKRVRQLRQQYRDMSTGAKILLLVLVAAAAMFAFMGVAALSCSIACSGSEALALVVFILGLGSIIVGMNALIKLIVGKGRRSKTKEQKTGTAAILPPQATI